MTSGLIVDRSSHRARRWHPFYIKSECPNLYHPFPSVCPDHRPPWWRVQQWYVQNLHERLIGFCLGQPGAGQIECFCSSGESWCSEKAVAEEQQAATTSIHRPMDLASYKQRSARNSELLACRCCKLQAISACWREKWQNGSSHT